MRKNCTSGSVRGASGNRGSYRKRLLQSYREGRLCEPKEAQWWEPRTTTTVTLKGPQSTAILAGLLLCSVYCPSRHDRGGNYVSH